MLVAKCSEDFKARVACDVVENSPKMASVVVWYGRVAQTVDN